MKQSVTNGMGLAKACCFTAILNTVFTAAALGQEVVTTNPDSSDGSGGAERIFRYGPWDLRPSVQGGVLYDDNIFIQPTDEESDLIFNISPGITIGMGDYQSREANMLTLEYAPNFILFTDNDDESTIEHQARLVGELNDERWRLTLSQEYAKLSGAVIDVGSRVDRNLYTTTGIFTYDLSPKTTFDVNARMLINDYDQVNDYNEWTVGGGADYQVTPKVTAGVGVIFGFLDVDNSVNQNYQQLLVRGSYEVTEKVTAKASIGGELRQFEGPQDGDENLVFSIGGTYQITPKTSAVLDGYRRVQNSVVNASENYTTLGASLGLRQTIREKFGVYGAVGYENADYSANSLAPSSSRDDDFYLLRAGVDWSVTDQVAAGLYYQYRKNDSTNPGVDFNNNQVGLSVTYQF